jgi:hypothetical protein
MTATLTCSGCGATVPAWMRYHHAPEGCGQYTEPAKGAGAEKGAKARNVRAEASDAPVPDGRSEAEIRHAIVKLLRTLGYGVWDTEQGYRKDGSTRVTKGLPDLFVAGPAGTAAVELKSAKGKQTPEQKGFGALWTKHGGTYMVWRSEADALAWCQEDRVA